MALETALSFPYYLLPEETLLQKVDLTLSPTFGAPLRVTHLCRAQEIAHITQFINTGHWLLALPVLQV